MARDFSRLFRKLAAFSLVTLIAPVVSAQTPIPLKISGDQVLGTIVLPGGISAELTISFESVVGLNPSALEASASLINPLDALLQARLPAGGLVTALAAFPVLVQVDPSPTSALSFSGVYSISLHTPNLTLDPSLPFALYSGAAGGPLHDVTNFVGIGSYRAGGSGPGFSDFLIVADARAIDLIIGDKFDALQGVLDANAASIPPQVLSGLQARFDQARSLYTSGQTAAAISEIVGFMDAVKTQSGITIPDVWRANDGLVNVAGLLRSAADTLKFSLNVKAGVSP